jgi:hypothetical protein
VRLVRYILLELAVGVTLLAGGGTAIYFGGQNLFETRPAQAAVEARRLNALAASTTAVPRGSEAAPAGSVARGAHDPTASLDPRAARDPHAAGNDDATDAPAKLAPTVQALAPASPPFYSGQFLGYADDVLLAPLRDHALTRVKFNKGGSSVSLRVDFADGGRAAFKPDQTNMASVPRKEVAAYRVNRLLGLDSVAPAIAGAFPREDVVAAMTPEALALLARFDAEVPSTEDGMVTGSLAWWIPEIVDAKIGEFHIDSVDGIVMWKRFLTIGEPIPREYATILPQVSEMVAFDFLIDNFDRWSGSNAKSSPDGKHLYFMDNALSFGLEETGQLKVRIYLKRSQKFSRHLYQALKKLDIDDVTDAMMTDTGPWPRLLTEEEIAAMMKRRDYMVAYIDELIAAKGEAAVLAFP